MSSAAGAILALLLHPHVENRAQVEIDAVIGRDRLPNFEDKDHLPYISAICREVLRWKVMGPLATAHASVKDDVYEGMFIPKGARSVFNALHQNRQSGLIKLIFCPSGSTIIGNVW